uniref:Tubulin-specific chaperone cofactor E-like protein n=1 Tax=Acrobeloides nanus TaxID=290746 RepID=A0A914C5B1_9BILA
MPDENETQIEDNSLLYHLEKKYLCEPEIEPCINIFGISPCQLANEGGLEFLVLNHMGISTIGDISKLSTLVRHVVELDLAWNDIFSWAVTETIFYCLPSLKRLNLSHNPLADTIVDGFSLRGSATNLRALSLNGVNLSLSTIQKFVSKLPSLDELHLSENDFSSIEDVSDTTPISTSVSILHLNAAGIQKWSTFLYFLRRFPNLVRLFAAENELETIEEKCPATGVQNHEVASCLRFLSLNNCQISDWRSIENLAHFTSLEELRVMHVPLFNEYSEEERYHLIVGRLRSIKLLNGSSISNFQREESERFFIRYYLNHTEKPRAYPELVGVHGQLEQLVKVDLTPRKHADVILECKETNYRVKIRIKLNKTVLELMKFAEQATGISLPRMRLLYFDPSLSEFGPTELRFPNQVLRTLHIEDGDEFYVQSKLLLPNQAILHKQVS